MTNKSNMKMIVSCGYNNHANSLYCTCYEQIKENNIYLQLTCRGCQHTIKNEINH